MKHKLKYLNLFEELTLDDIPYSKFDDDGKLYIKFPKSVTSVPPVYNELTTEVTGGINIKNTDLNTIEGFNKLKFIGWCLTIIDNIELTQVTGFNQLQRVGGDLAIENNPNLVTLSMPSTIIRSVNYDAEWYIMFEKYYFFKSPKKFVNSDSIIQDCIEKFNPGIHGGVVIKQIMENLELWGTPATKATIVNHLLSKGNYWSLIPTKLQRLAEEHYKHMYEPKYNNTGAKSVAKVATGVTYGLF